MQALSATGGGRRDAPGRRDLAEGLPDLLGDERHDRVQQPADAVERRREHPLGRRPGLRVAQPAFQELKDLASGDLGRGRIAPVLVFQLAFLQAAIGDHHAMRDADELPVGKHGAWALAAVVQ